MTFYTVKDAAGADVKFEAEDIGGGVMRPTATAATDQSQPGTSDLYTPRFTRPCYPIHQSVSLAGSYASGDTVGGLIGVVCKDEDGNVLPEDTLVFVSTLAMLTQGTAALGNSQWLVFAGAPANSTLTDSVSAVVDPADFPNVVGVFQDGPLTLNSGATGPVSSRITVNMYVPLDADGKFYVARVYASGAISTATATLTGDVRH